MDIHLISEVGCAGDTLFGLKKRITMTVLYVFCWTAECNLIFFIHFRQMTSEKVKISLVTQGPENTDYVIHLQWKFTLNSLSKGRFRDL